MNTSDNVLIQDKLKYSLYHTYTSYKHTYGGREARCLEFCANLSESDKASSWNSLDSEWQTLIIVETCLLFVCLMCLIFIGIHMCKWKFERSLDILSLSVL